MSVAMRVAMEFCAGSAGQLEGLSALFRRALADVVLLPVQRGVGLDDDVLVRGLL
jgi:hypothetical protein